jgi:hypothetical protein
MFVVRRVFHIAFAIGLAMSLSACMTTKSYVDNSLPAPHYADLKKPTQPQPVQLLFEFQSKGVANASVTQSLKSSIYEQVSQSGLFSQVSYTPVQSGRTLSIAINNVPITTNAAAKGFGTGLTFGLVGTGVTDGYICTSSYVSPGHDPVIKEARHAIYTTIGNASGPAGLQPMPLDQAVRTVIAQMVAKTLEDIDNSSDIAQ